MRILVYTPVILCVYFCTVMSRSMPPARLTSPTLQADCGSIKGSVVPAEEGTKRYLTRRWIRDKFNHCQRRNTESRRQLLLSLSFSSDGHEFGGNSPLPLYPPLPPPLPLLPLTVTPSTLRHPGREKSAVGSTLENLLYARILNVCQKNSNVLSVTF